MTQQDVNPYAPPAADVDAGSVAPLVAGDLRLAERGTRLGAVIIDRLLLIGALVPGIILWVMTGKAPIGLPLTALPVAALVTYQWYLISTSGQSLAKRWLGIRIVKLDGSPVTFGSGVAMRSIVPGICSMLGALGTIFSLVDACMIFAADRRCLHDHMAGTKVIIA